jgi:hypothetical protein
MRSELRVSDRASTGLVEILDRVLDKGLVVAGDIQVMLADIELLTIRIRLIVCSLDKAEKIGIDWWRTATYLSSGIKRKKGSTKRLKARQEPKKSSRKGPARHEAVREASGRVRSRRARSRSD